MMMKWRCSGLLLLATGIAAWAGEYRLNLPVLSDTAAVHSQGSGMPLVELGQAADTSQVNYPARFLIGRTEDRLVFSASALRMAQMPQSLVATRDGQVWNDDSFEFRLKDAADNSIIFIVNAAGVIFDSRNHDAQWNGKWQVNARVIGAKEAAIGTERGMEITVEIPLADLQLDFNQSARIQVYFNLAGRNPMAALVPYATGERLDQVFADLLPGGTGNRIDIPRYQDDGGMVTFSGASGEAMTLAGRYSDGISWQEAVPSGNFTTEFKVEGGRRYEWRAENSRFRFPFQAFAPSPVKLTAVPVLSRQAYFLRVAGDAPDTTELRLTLTRGDEVLWQSEVFTLARTSGAFQLELPWQLTWGADAETLHVTAAWLRNGEWQTVGNTPVAIPCVLPDYATFELPAGLPEIPAPFQALSATRMQTVTGQRTYEWGKSIFIDQAFANGEALFARAPELTGRVDGQPIAWQLTGWELVESTPAQARYQGEAQAGALQLHMNTTVAFDGMVHFQWSLTAAQPVEVADLAFRVFPTTDSARWFMQSVGTNPSVDVANWQKSGDIKPGTWSGKWTPFLFVGNGKIGQEWCFEHTAGWRWSDPERAVEIQRTSDHTELVFRLQDGSRVLDRAWSFSSGFIATPVRDDGNPNRDLTGERITVASAPENMTQAYNNGAELYLPMPFEEWHLPAAIEVDAIIHPAVGSTRADGAWQGQLPDAIGDSGVLELDFTNRFHPYPNVNVPGVAREFFNEYLLTLVFPNQSKVVIYWCPERGPVLYHEANENGKVSYPLVISQEAKRWERDSRHTLEVKWANGKLQFYADDELLADTPYPGGFPERGMPEVILAGDVNVHRLAVNGKETDFAAGTMTGLARQNGNELEINRDTVYQPAIRLIEHFDCRARGFILQYVRDDHSLRLITFHGEVLAQVPAPFAAGKLHRITLNIHRNSRELEAMVDGKSLMKVVYDREWPAFDNGPSGRYIGRDGGLKIKNIRISRQPRPEQSPLTPMQPDAGTIYFDDFRHDPTPLKLATPLVGESGNAIQLCGEWRYDSQAQMLTPAVPKRMQTALENNRDFGVEATVVMAWNHILGAGHGWIGNPEHFARCIQEANRLGIKILPYMPDGVCHLDPEYAQIRYEISYFDPAKEPIPHWEVSDSTCLGSDIGYRRNLWTADRLLKEGVGGFYLDGIPYAVSAACPSRKLCSNPLHGHDEVKDPFTGAVVAVARIFDTRRYMIDLARLIQYYVPDGIIDAHMSNGYNAATMTTVNSATHGELLGLSPDWKRDFTVANYRPELISRQYGWVGNAIFYQFQPIPPQAAVAMTGIHGQMPRIAWGIWNNQATQMWRIFDRFGLEEAEFIPYYEGNPTQAAVPVYASIFRRPERDLILAANWSDAPVEAELVVDGTARLLNTGVELPSDGAGIKYTMPPRILQIIEVNRE